MIHKAFDERKFLSRHLYNEMFDKFSNIVLFSRVREEEREVFNTVLQSLTISEFKSHFQLTPTQTEVFKLMPVLLFANLICIL